MKETEEIDSHATASPEAEETTTEEIREETAGEAVAEPGADEGEAATPAEEEAAAGPAEPEDPETRTRDMEQQFLRLRADFDNFRKRTAREKQEWNQRALENLAGDLLVVLDHFDLGLQTAEKEETPPPVLDGFKMVYQQLLSSLGKYEIKPIEAEGQPFDHAWHEAITTMASDEVPADHVMGQAKRGYRIGDRLLRAAQVVVSSGPVADETAADGGEENDDE